MTGWIELAKILKELGLATGAFILCAWVVVYIVKKMAVNLDKLEITIDKLISKLDINMARVEKEHKAQEDDHQEFSAQNKEITAVLGRINGYRKD